MAPTDPRPGRPVVLVVEDNDDHAALIQAAFSYGAPLASVHVTGSSEEAMDYLQGKWPFTDRRRFPAPEVIILDIGLPGMDGLGFLRWLSTRNEPWANTPVVVFSGAADRTTTHLAFALGAREVKVKPSDFGELVDVVTHVLARWQSDVG